MFLIADVPTVLKLSTVQSDELPEDYKVNLDKSTKLQISSYLDIGSHLKITLTSPLKGRYDWCVYENHISLFDDDGLRIKGIYKDGDPLPSRVNLPVPYLSQLDNEFSPYGTCNVTSVAMVLAYYDIPSKQMACQREDELFRILKLRGWDRHVHSHLVKLMGLYGLKSKFSVNTSWLEIRRSLANKRPVIISGKFTKSGHIIVLRGYDKFGFLVNDPYGEWYPWQGNGTFGHYDTSKSGQNLRYSYNAMFRAGYSGKVGTWAHLFDRDVKVKV